MLERGIRQDKVRGQPALRLMHTAVFRHSMVACAQFRAIDIRNQISCENCEVC